ncbi:MAG: hypothetical protein HFH72_02980 [Lachnospiraceae bacterium]|nr:hypothetical protein [Lachnospiraceae bacterium]
MDTIFQYNLPAAAAGKKIVIFGCFKSARNFAMRLLNQNIRFDYFLCPVKGEYVYPHVLNKPVIGFEECRHMEDIIIVSSRMGMERAKEILCGEGLLQYFVECESLHPVIRNTSSLIVWGTGGRAKKFCEDYRELLDIKYFCDSDEKKAGTHFEGKEVIHFSALESLPEDTAVIIASTFYEDIFQKAVQLNIREGNILILQYSLDEYMKAKGSRLGSSMIFVGSEKSDFMLYADTENYFLHNEQVISELIYNYKNQKIVLYGEKAIVNEMIQKMKMLDMSVFGQFGRDTIQEDGSIYRLLSSVNVDEVVLLLDRFSDKTESVLKQMKIHYIWLESYNGYQFLQDKTIEQFVDPNLGLCFHKQDEEFAGFIKFEYAGGKNHELIKIVCLGDSTTSAYRIREKSWSECLSESLKGQEVSHIIYCGGMQTYTVSQELVKLVRDVIVMEPDIVLSYSGANDMGLACTRKVARKNPFISLYQTSLFMMVSRLKGYEVNWGLEDYRDYFEYWYAIERMMYAICREFNIKFKAFLQPMLGAKADCFQEDADIAVLYGYLYDIEKGEYYSKDYDQYSKIYLKWAGTDSHSYYSSILKWAKRFRKCGEKICVPWFCDISNLFDNERGIYVDDIHVHERGNYLIAGKVLEEIKGDINLIINQNE